MLLQKKNKQALGIEQGDLEENFDSRIPIIFPTKSPVSAMTGESDVEPPEPIDSGVFSRLSKAIKKKLMPLISAKKDMDDVYSRGYFERHYPDADENLKGLLHEHAMSSWAHAMGNDGHEEPDGDEKPAQIMLTININK